MRAHLAAAAAVALLLFVPSADARQQGSAATQAQGQPQNRSQPPAQSAPPSAESMGVSLKGVRQQLDKMPAEKKPTATGMRYDFFVDVLGKRPAIDFFKDFDLSTRGAVRWGTPTHQEILNAVSPNWVTGAMPAGGLDLLSLVRKK